MNTFKGTQFRLSNHWRDIIPLPECLNYLEIGLHYGANFVSVIDNYGKHPDSTFTGIDPWLMYDDMTHTQEKQDAIYNMFLENTRDLQGVTIYRDTSFNVLHSLPNDTFNLIYIDGDHAASSVLEDGVLSFRKLKSGGYMIFDDYGWGGPDLTQRGIDAFLNGYRDLIKHINTVSSQLFIQKL